MHCLVCQSATKVINSRTADQERAIKRRRVCVACSRRFTTYERVELVGLRVVKRNKSREPYVRHKLEVGIRKALEKRPYTEPQIQKLIGAIEGDIFNIEKDTVSSEQIGHIVLSHLQEFDKVAYLRFASVYRKFGSTKAFEKEIQKLEKKK
ncbi:MAG: transcriptional repressor NrdR [Candidatus Wildermuthbacteria bacterium]|nr:transcriptional repressor NrdR [Candidatus Wildermuthbacteria bacterium]